MASTTLGGKSQGTELANTAIGVTVLPCESVATTAVLLLAGAALLEYGMLVSAGFVGFPSGDVADGFDVSETMGIEGAGFTGVGTTVADADPACVIVLVAVKESTGIWATGMPLPPPEQFHEGSNPISANCCGLSWASVSSPPPPVAMLFGTGMTNCQSGVWMALGAVGKSVV